MSGLVANLESRSRRIAGSSLAVGSVGAVAVVSGAAVAHASDSRVELVLGVLVLGAVFFAGANLGFKAVLGWIVLEPILYAFARYPRAHSLLTFDRLWLVVTAACLLTAARSKSVRETRLVIFGFLWLVLSFGLRAALTRAGARYAIEVWLDAIVLPALLFLFVRAYVRDQGRMLAVSRACAVAGGFLGALGVLERLAGFQLATLSGGTPRYDTAIAAVRVSGPYPVPEVYALVLLICLAATLYWLQAVGRGVYLAGGIIVLVELAGIGLTFFRTAWIASVLVLFAAFGMRRGRLLRTIGTACVVGLIGVALYSQLEHYSSFSTRVHNTQNLNARFATYREGFDIFKKSPLFGVGVARYTSAALQLPATEVAGVDAVPYPHDSFLGLLSEQGVIGFLPLAFLAVGASVLLRRFQRVAVDSADQIFGSCATAAALAYLAMSLPLAMLSYGPSNSFFAVILGMVAGRLETLRSRS